MRENKNPDDFISQTTRAAETFLERTAFVVSQEDYMELLAFLDAPAKPNERLRKTMQAKIPWE
jgi:uncharacterized protein (DUF1778 family)